ncbi:DDE-type integrase/transposase/recombinase [Sphingobacterium sp. JUb56]|uniref:DDE-type integrase/transposase/recombinase n=1 Tax=Sphingobacterium sp. JUb56 TaxID=2587145 RepID=UPI00160FEDEA|nr:DDE-type integrase/transposase/recombinase [Sphingobacterium sp. JUb56]MBB2950747.1 transposase InsO family protein [Sphingobacterium sp. JUb56]
MIEIEVLQAFENSKKIYGSPRITLELHKKAISVSRPRVARIMKKAKLRSTRQGWLYLTTVIDLGDRKIIGWALSTTMKANDTVLPAFKMAQSRRPVTRQLIFHSDRGVQYACNEFRGLLEKNPLIIRSMSRKGNCWDNAVAESFFKTLKAECVYQYNFIDKEQHRLSHIS